MKFPNSSKLVLKILKKHKLTKRELSETLKVSEQFVGQMARGERGIPRECAIRLREFVGYSEIERAAVSDFRKFWREG